MATRKQPQGKPPGLVKPPPPPAPPPRRHGVTVSPPVFQAGGAGSIPAGAITCSHTYGVVHGVAECTDCGWSTESYKNAQALAKLHAARYGHHVSGELGIAFSYNGRTR